MINGLEAQNKKLSQLLDPEIFVHAIRQGVTSGLKIKQGNKSAASSGGYRYTSKPYLGKPCLPQLSPAVDCSLNLELSCQHCKDTSHLMENCIKLIFSGTELLIH